MPPHHIERFTGVLNSCLQRDLCPLPSQVHFPRREQALHHLQREWRGRVERHHQPPAVVRALEEVVSHGLHKPQGATLAAQEKLLRSEGSFSLLPPLYRQTPRRDTVLRVAATLLREQPHRRGEWESAFTGVLPVGSELILRLPLLLQASPADYAWVAEHLWLKRHSPLHSLAELLLLKPQEGVTGYLPRGSSTVRRFPVAAHARSLSLSPTALPPGVVAYDVETDTTHGLGLVPCRTQVTEVVLAQREEALVITGDERFILREMASFLNALPATTLLVGWNNYNYDNIMLQTRAQLHQVEGWGGALTPTVNHSFFIPRGPEAVSLKLQWATSGGGFLPTGDCYQLLMSRPAKHREVYSLKGFVKTLGATPVEVDRSALHLLAPEERELYALSDGLSTLLAWGALSRSGTPRTA